MGYWQENYSEIILQWSGSPNSSMLTSHVAMVTIMYHKTQLNVYFRCRPVTKPPTTAEPMEEPSAAACIAMVDLGKANM